MKIIPMLFVTIVFTTTIFGQTKTMDLFDLVKKIIPDSSSENGSPGNWAVGHPSMFPIQWQVDRIEMSEDLTVNFFRKGTAMVYVKGSTNEYLNTPSKWSVMFRGARSGYTGFSITSNNNKNIAAKQTIENIFGQRSCTYTLLKTCNKNGSSGFYYYEVKIPKKQLTWIKIETICTASGCALNLDCYDDWTKKDVDLSCSKN